MFKRFQKDSKSSRPRSGSILAGKRLCQPDRIWPHKLSETITSCCWERESETVPTCGPLSALCLRSIPWPVAGLLDHLLNSKHTVSKLVLSTLPCSVLRFHPRSCSLFLARISEAGLFWAAQALQFRLVSRCYSLNAVWCASQLELSNMFAANNHDIPVPWPSTLSKTSGVII